MLCRDVIHPEWGRFRARSPPLTGTHSLRCTVRSRAERRRQHLVPSCHVCQASPLGSGPPSQDDPLSYYSQIISGRQSSKLSRVTMTRRLVLFSLLTSSHTYTPYRPPLHLYDPQHSFYIFTKFLLVLPSPNLYNRLHRPLREMPCRACPPRRMRAVSHLRR